MADFEAQRDRKRKSARKNTATPSARTPKGGAAAGMPLYLQTGQTVNQYRFTVDGKTITLNETEYRSEVSRITKRLRNNFALVEDEALYNAREHRKFLDETHNWAGVISDILAETAPPSVGMWTTLNVPLKRGREALDEGKVDVAARQLQVAQDALQSARREWNAYINETIGGADTAIAALKTTRDISFGIAIGAAAVVAAPIVMPLAAAAAGSAGLTGAAATGAAALATGATVTTGGAVVGAGLRGGTSATGQLLAGGSVNLNDVKSEAIEGAKRGAVDAGSSIVGFGAGKALGPGASLVGKAIKGGAAGFAGGSFGGGLDATIHGKSAGEVLEAAGKQGLSGTLGGAIGGGSAHFLGDSSAGARFATGALGGSAGGAAGAALTGGDIKEGAIAGGIAGGVASIAQHQPASKDTFGDSLELDYGKQPTREVPLNELDLQHRGPSKLELDTGLQSTREAAPLNEFDLLHDGPSGLELDLGPQPTRESAPLREFEPQHDGPSGLELDTTLQPTGEAQPLAEFEQQQGTSSGLELDLGPQPTRQAAPLREFDSQQQGPSGLKTYGGKKFATEIPGVKRAKQTFGQASSETAGTFERKGASFNELNAAEIALGLRVDYDPVAGRPRKVSYRVVPEASGRKSATDRSFSKDTSTEGAQATNAAYEKSGYDKGHLPQREAFKGSRETERAVDMMTGVVPMTPELNRGKGSAWRESEQRAMALARDPKNPGGVIVEIEPIYDANPKRLPDGTPIPKSIRRRILSLDGAVIEDGLHSNQ